MKWRRLRPVLAMPETVEQSELGLDVESLGRAEEALRGRYDVSRLKRDHPQLVRLVEWLIGLRFVAWDEIAKNAGIAWETVAAIAADRREPIREFKGRKAAELKVILDAASPHLLDQARRGKLSVFDFKLLTDCFLLMAGEATAIVGTAERQPDPDEEELRRLLAARDVSPMHLGSGGKFALGSGPAAALGGLGPVERVAIEAETVPGDSQSVVVGE